MTVHHLPERIHSERVGESECGSGHALLYLLLACLGFWAFAVIGAITVVRVVARIIGGS